jgi:RimJ/RimL family protein N-acetyltransferase
LPNRPLNPESTESSLRAVTPEDVRVFFEHQLDAEAGWMAAFTVEDPADEEAFRRRWDRILADETITKRTVVLDGEVAGHVVCFERMGKREVSYWLGRGFWGRGLGTRALRRFLTEIEERPLYARVAHDNHASARVLRNCGFLKVGEEKGFANARGEEIGELVFVLDGRPSPGPR